MLPLMPSMPAPSATRVVVALDGPASSGKSSVGSAAAARLGLRFVDTGLIYRALTALALREGVATDDVAGLVGLVDRVALGDDGSGRLARVLLDGDDATGTVHTQEVDAAVSAVARVPEVRAALLGRQRALTAGGGIILAGRDIGTVVLPDAPLKLYLDASVEERASRRIAERGLDPEGDEANLVREQLRARDAQDRGRAVAPLRPAHEAVVISTDGLGFEQTVDLVAATIARAETAASAPVAVRAPAPVPAIKREKPEPAARREEEPGPRDGDAPGQRPDAPRADDGARRADLLAGLRAYPVRGPGPDPPGGPRDPRRQPHLQLRCRRDWARGSRRPCGAAGSTGSASASCSTGRSWAGSRPKAGSTRWTAGPRTWRRSAWPSGSWRPATSC